MAQKLFGKNIPPACEYCSIGKPTTDRQMILCPKQGVVSPLYACRKFDYDPLKRIPRQRHPLGDYSDQDFSLDS